MALVQVRDVPEQVVSALKERAALQGMTLASLVRAELVRLVGRPDNVEVLNQALAPERSDGPELEEILAVFAALDR